MARRSRPARRCQERVSGCLSAALKRALPGALGCAKRTSKDVQPDVRSCILVCWAWGKALTSLAPSSSGCCWPPVWRAPRPLPAGWEETGIRAVLQTSCTRQTSSIAARDDAKLCLRNPNQQPSWLGWRKESSSITLSTLMGCFTVLGLGNPPVLLRNSQSSPSLPTSLTVPAVFLG